MAPYDMTSRTCVPRCAASPSGRCLHHPWQLHRSGQDRMVLALYSPVAVGAPCCMIRSASTFRVAMWSRRFSTTVSCATHMCVGRSGALPYPCSCACMRLEGRRFRCCHGLHPAIDMGGLDGSPWQAIATNLILVYLQVVQFREVFLSPRHINM